MLYEDLTRSMEPVISIRNLNHFYGTGTLEKQVLFDINLDINAGEIVIMTGPSGSGKTTLLTLLGGLRAAQSGALSCLGQSLAGASEDELVAVRRHIGYIFQAHNLLPFMTAQQNVCMSLEMHPEISRRVAKSRADEVLQQVGLGDRIDYYPKNLSGGQKQRVAIARALASQPKLVLADEPTASLDKKTGRDVVDLMHDLVKQQGCTILLVTHDNRILDIADRIIHMEDGRLVTAAPPAIPSRIPGPSSSKFSQASAFELADATPSSNGSMVKVLPDASSVDIANVDMSSIDTFDAGVRSAPQPQSLQAKQTLVPGSDLAELAAYSPQPLTAVGFSEEPAADTALHFSTHTLAPQPAKFKVVCIDTDTEFLDAVGQMLDQEYFETIAIDDPASALVAVLKHRPDMILLEVKISNFNGYQLCKLLRQNPLLKRTPIIITTRQKRNIVGRIKAKLSGASGYLVKPLSQLNLITTIFPHAL